MFYFVVGGVVIFLLLQYKKHLSEGYGYASRAVAPVSSRILPVPQAYKEILQKYFQYYQQLSQPNKLKFENKITHFISTKRFIPRNIDEITLEAKVLIAASAVQLTFGLPNIYLRHFNKILVYPNDYYSSITRRHHKGEVNPRFGIIVLSWQAFVDGYIYPNDSVNLGLHEMAHALRLENMIRNEEYKFLNDNELEQLDAWCHKICSNEHHEQHNFFRPYACVNEHEFFSVAVENFFERSADFKNALPELYNVLTRLLKQDPLTLK